MTESYIQLCFDEARQSQLPCVEMLVNMGWSFLPNADLEVARGKNPEKFLLKDICERSLDKINRFKAARHFQSQRKSSDTAKQV